jgi:hypothetical protein
MKKEKIDKLTSALESAGFEVVSLKEETYRHLGIGRGFSSAFTSGENSQPGLLGKTGVVMLEITEL